MHGYMRTVVTRFEKGGTDTVNNEEVTYVKVVVQYQFRAGGGALGINLDCSQDPEGCFQERHKTMMSNVLGKLNVESQGVPAVDVAGLEVQNTAWGGSSQIKRKFTKYFKTGFISKHTLE